MAEAHKLQTLQQLKNRLVKSASNVDTESEMIIDALRALEDVEVNKYLINKSGLGNTLADMRRESCKNHASIKAMITNILKKWREIAVAEQSSSSAAGSAPVPTAAATKAQPAAKPVTVSIPTGDSQLAAENHTRKLALSSDRKGMVQVLSKVFQKFLDDTAKADQIALGIEQELNKVHHHDKAKQQYTAKAKSLSFNLTKNEELRTMLVDGSMPFHRLVTLTPVELASNELKQSREKLALESTLARRSDIEDLYRKEIQADLGIDANELWAYDNGDDSNSENDADGGD